MSDYMVKEVQKWYNQTYVGRTGYLAIDEDGIVGPGTCKALIRALQMELNISGPNGVFGPGTISAFDTVVIKQSTTNRNLIRILQGGFYCKGIECGGFDGGYGSKLSQAVIKFKSFTGIGGGDPIDSKHMKALLNTDPFVQSRDGKTYVRTAQQFLNLNYSDYFWKNVGLIPCNGIVDRNMTKALAYALQYEEGERGSGLDGIVGTNTLNRAPVLSQGSNSSAFIKLLQIGLICMTNQDAGLDGIFDASLKESLSKYQKFMCLNQDPTVSEGVACRKTWASILLSKGDVTRFCDACDCSQKLSLKKAQALQAQGYRYVGRYLTGTVGGSRDKSLSLDEIQSITEAGLAIFAIYQDGGASASYFNYAKGYSDAQKALTAAGNLKIPNGEILYFAVDYDFMAEQTTEIVIPHFQGINDYFNQVNSSYKIGIYGSRNICTMVSKSGLACSSFVADMSTGYSGNMGYPLPDNWAFDQFYEFNFTNYPNFDGAFDLDKNVASGRYTGFNAGDYSGGHYAFPVSLDTIRSEVAAATDITDIIVKIEQLEEVYRNFNEEYDNYNPEDIGEFSSRAILSYLYHLKYDDWKFSIVTPGDDGFINYVKIMAAELHESLLQYISDEKGDTIETRGLLITDKKYGVFELPHLAIGIRAFQHSVLAKESWSSWAGDLASAVKEVGSYCSNTGAPYLSTAQTLVGAHEGRVTDILDRHQYNYCDLIANADCYEIAEIIKNNSTYGVNLLSFALRKYYVTDQLYMNRYQNYLHTFTHPADQIISSQEYNIDTSSLAQKLVAYFNAPGQMALRYQAKDYKSNVECIEATFKMFVNAIKYLDTLKLVI